mgnify:CR=1 FL=1
MKRVGKPVFFVVAILIIAFTALSLFGIHTQWGDTQITYVKGVTDISWGIDIKGGVEAIYTPTDPDNATPEQLEAAETVIEQRLLGQNITDSEVYTDTDKMRVIVRFPWPSDESIDAQQIVDDLGQQAELTFRKGTDQDESTGAPTGEVILTGSDVASATAESQQVDQYSGKTEYVVHLSFTDEGKQKFSDATSQMAGTGDPISIWLDDELVSAPTVESAITDGQAIISGEFTASSANSLAQTINSGSLPIQLQVDTYSNISPTLGLKARNVMCMAGVIAFVLIAIFMIFRYRLPGAVSAISLLGHVGLTIAAISGFFSIFPSFTLTLPGIAGIVLGLGMGVDANILTASRIKEELDAGRTIDGAIATGSRRGFTAVFDGNITVLLISIILMGAFGAPDSLFAMLLKPFFFMFGGTTEGTIFSFGYTMFVGVICNLFFNVLLARLMIKSLSKFKCFRKAKFFGGAK